MFFLFMWSQRNAYSLIDYKYKSTIHLLSGFYKFKKLLKLFYNSIGEGLHVYRSDLQFSWNVFASSLSHYKNSDRRY